MLGQDIEHFWKNVECSMSLHAYLGRVCALFSGSLQLQIVNFPALYVFSVVHDYYVSLGFSTVTQNTYFDFVLPSQLC